MFSTAGTDALTVLHPAVPGTAAGHQAAPSWQQGCANIPPVWGVKKQSCHPKGEGFCSPWLDRGMWWSSGEVQVCPASSAAAPVSVTSSDITAGQITCYFPSLAVPFPAITASAHLGRRKQQRAVKRAGLWGWGSLADPRGVWEGGGAVWGHPVPSLPLLSAANPQH